ncbi:MAG: hypothetical protein QOF51_119 [Chloroflexota bacterium]|jgi:hypothetical protein|nr:hypothetical protein [Chloroflexota bacterium]
MSRGEKRPAVVREVTVLVGGERLKVSGRTALLIGLLAAEAQQINAMPVGQIVAHVAHGELKLELHEVRSVIRFAEE